MQHCFKPLYWLFKKMQLIHYIQIIKLRERLRSKNWQKCSFDLIRNNILFWLCCLHELIKEDSIPDIVIVWKPWLLVRNRKKAVISWVKVQHLIHPSNVRPWFLPMDKSLHFNRGICHVKINTLSLVKQPKHLSVVGGQHHTWRQSIISLTS